tara:strand:- start:5392 stop:5937 length:546 start_codon:yes stop_codon:yes gene_type:complete
MATHVEMEMNSCLTEMERLQAKMMEFQETKKKQEAEQEEKTIEAELNMTVMENWLDIYHFNQEQKKMSEVAKKNYDDYLVRIRGRNIRQNPFSTKEEEECKKINDDYYKYCSTKSDKYHSWIVPNNLKNMKMFHIEKYKTPDTPSQFMFDFIEATYNLFQIQQKRIDELETVVAELNAKIQ